MWEKWKKLKSSYSDKYRESHLAEDSEQARIVIGAITFLVIAFIYVDYLFFGLGQMFALSVLWRGLFCAISLIVIRHLKKQSTVKAHDYLILAWTCSLAALTLASDLTRPSSFNDNIVLHTVMILGSYSLIPNRLLFKTIPALIFSSADLLTLIFFKTGISYPALVISGVSFLAINVIGIVSAQRLDLYRHKQYDIQMHEYRNHLQLVELATTDSLTNLYNRRRFIELAEIEFDRYKRFGRIFSFVVMDIDKFKHINDTYGHPIGDVVLQKVSELLLTGKRSIDIVGRLGGDEIGIILPGTSAHDAAKVIRRIQSAQEDLTLNLSQSGFSITLSAGITEAHTKDESVDDLYRRADKSLYLSKHKKQAEDKS